MDSCRWRDVKYVPLAGLFLHDLFIAKKRVYNAHEHDEWRGYDAGPGQAAAGARAIVCVSLEHPVCARVCVCQYVYVYSNDINQALIEALKDPPIHAKEQASKVCVCVCVSCLRTERNVFVCQDLMRDCVLSVVAEIRDDDIASYLEELDERQIDILLQYVYRGFALGNNSASLLKWHSKIVAGAGIGAIVRVMASGKACV